MAGELERLGAVGSRPDVGGDDGIRVIACGLSGGRDEARRAVLKMRETSRLATFLSWTGYLEAWLDGRVTDMLVGMAALDRLQIWEHPEAIFQEGGLLCDVGAHDEGLPRLQRAVDKGYTVAPTLVARPQFDALRGRPGLHVQLRP